MTNLLDKARSLADSGNLSAARDAYRQILSVEGNNPDLLEEVGFLEVQAGQFQQAIGLMKLALSFRSNDPSSHLNLAEVYKLAGANELARQHYDQVIALDPNDGDAHYGLARLNVESNKWSDAAINLEQALLRAPTDAEILFLQAIVLGQLEDWKQAEKTYLKIISLYPNHFDAIVALARLYHEGNRLSQAIKYFNIAENLSPLSSDDLISLIEALTTDGRAKEAIQVANKLLLSSSLSTSALARRGRVMSTLGMFDEAEKDFRAAIQSNSKETGPYEQLGAIQRLTDRDLERLETNVTRADAKSDELMSNWFALFNGYKQRKDYPRAFEALKKASDLHLKDHPIDADEIRNSISRMINIFDQDFFGSRTAYGYKKDGPIFIVGMPRSGTTLTERVLAAHPQVIGRGERFAVPNIINDLDDFPNSVGQLTKDWSMKSGRALHQDMLPSEQAERFTIDKLPGNYLYVGLISMLLPNARVIWCKRSPMDNCLSCYEQNFSTGWAFTYSLEHLGVAYRQHERIMRHWMDVCPIPVHTVQYEELVSEPEKTARAMLDYIGLEWDSASLNPEQVDSNIATASLWQARQPINTGSVERWRKYEKQLQPLIKALEEN